jgi:hypothetical protein
VKNQGVEGDSLPALRRQPFDRTQVVQPVGDAEQDKLRVDGAFAANALGRQPLDHGHDLGAELGVQPGRGQSSVADDIVQQGRAHRGGRGIFAGHDGCDLDRMREVTVAVGPALPVMGPPRHGVGAPDEWKFTAAAGIAEDARQPTDVGAHKTRVNDPRKDST